MKGSIKKTVILLAALAFPTGIFLFLKTFGKNEFSVEPLFQKEPLAMAVECGPVLVPYLLAEDKLIELQWWKSDSLTFYFFSSATLNEKELALRLAEMPKDKNIRLYKIESDSARVDDEVTTLLISEENASLLRSCFFMMDRKMNTVLVDSKRRIRGHYNVAEREEIDRLLVEVRIITSANP
jgi:hypothetical protein